VRVQGNRDTARNEVPSVVLAAEHYNMLVRLVQAGVPVQLRIEVGARFYENDHNSYNVLAEIPGADPVLRDEVCSWELTWTRGTRRQAPRTTPMASPPSWKRCGFWPRSTLGRAGQSAWLFGPERSKVCSALSLTWTGIFETRPRGPALGLPERRSRYGSDLRLLHAAE